MTNQLLSLLQICDSNFPSGAFSHSFGLETYIYEQKIHDPKTFTHALGTYVKTQLTYTDGLACRLVYEYMQHDCTEKLWELDVVLSSLSLAKETREGNRRIGERMVKLCNQLYDCPILMEYEQFIRRKELSGHAAIAFMLICNELGIHWEKAIAAYLYAAVQSLVQNAVRAIPLGQTDGQRLLVSMHPLVQETVEMIRHASEGELGMNAPGLEIAQMRHEQLPVRLFMS
ncbi:urease accessory protein UreF [Ectobacillus panaciterrae]|uniref:urease accessory protein UreF n=1 Tax=Ectobacillus panaciterrae TaxID=363872 RepID=UPI000403C147|nr:urease accessory protein UreF [Ectobacillus panaciterrae]